MRNIAVPLTFSVFYATFHFRKQKVNVTLNFPPYL